jgi:hypothetical protein
MLPADWCDRVLRWKPESSLLAPYVEYLQAVVREHGAASIMIQRLQELALSVCGLARDPLFVGHLEIFGRIEALGGLDPLDAPLKERRVQKQLYEIVEDIESAEAEWLGLDALVLRKWTIDPFARTKGSPDWQVSREGRSVEVDVKNKASRSAAWMRLTWALRGVALCPEHQFMNEFQWQWDVPESCRSKQASWFMRCLWEALPKLEGFLCGSGNDDAAVLWSQNGWSLVATRDEHRTHLSFYERRDALNSNLILSLGCEPTVDTRLFRSGSSSAAFLEEFGLDSRQTLSNVLGRLGIGKQAHARATPTLFLIVWHVPFTWEPSLHDDQLQEALDALTAEQNWPPSFSGLSDASKSLRPTGFQTAELSDCFSSLTRRPSLNHLPFHAVRFPSAVGPFVLATRESKGRSGERQ